MASQRLRVSSGTLSPRIQRKNGKEYPAVANRVPVARAYAHPEHYYWNYFYTVHKQSGGWKNRCISVPRVKVAAVREAIARRRHHSEIIAIIHSKA